MKMANELRHRKQGEEKPNLDYLTDPNYLVAKTQKSGLLKDFSTKKALLSVIILTIFAFITRFWLISHPDQVVFDEVHFGKFGSYYLRGTYYFDVHPPLGKMMFGAMGWAVGFDGSYLFDKIGEDYVSRQVPYIALRSLPAFFGALLVPVVYGILYESDHSLLACFLGAAMTLLDTALITQQRLILLDSFLIFFDILSVYTWIKFYKQRFSAFSLNWWIWILATGISLSLATGIKMVGLFVVALVGFATMHDLWRIIDHRRGLSLNEVLKHFFARVFALIILPIVLYLAFFAIHFKIVHKTGPGDAFMSPSFQSTLDGNRMNKESLVPYYGANITLMHYQTASYLHSHAHNYPLRYDDDRVSSQGQQVTGYPHDDSNNVWIISPQDGILTETDNGETVPRPLKTGDIIRLRHFSTQKYLLTHDVASPLTPTHQEVTCAGEDKPERYNETLWKLIDESGTDGKLIASIDTQFRLQHMVTKVNLHSHKGKYGEWGFGQQEVNGNKTPKDKSNYWIISSVEGPHPPKTAREKFNDGKPGLISKFLELQGAMLTHNAALTGSHPFQSSPWTWPILQRGISFWINNHDAQIYLLGNPVVWWLCCGSIITLLTVVLLDAIITRRGISEMNQYFKRRLYMTGGFFFGGWLLHYLPFFLMGRALFLHHYLPALVYSILIFTHLIDLTVKISGSLKWPLFLFSLSVSIYGFYCFMPIAYGISMTPETVSSRKWMESWDFSYGLK